MWVNARADWHSWRSRDEGSSTPVYSAKPTALGQPRHPKLQASTKVQHWGASQLLSVPQGMCWHGFLSLLDSLWLSLIFCSKCPEFMDTSMFSNNADWQCACFIFYPWPLLQLRLFWESTTSPGDTVYKMICQSQKYLTNPLISPTDRKKKKLNRIRSSSSLKWNALNPTDFCETEGLHFPGNSVRIKSF